MSLNKSQVTKLSWFMVGSVAAFDMSTLLVRCWLGLKGIKSMIDIFYLGYFLTLVIASICLFSMISVVVIAGSRRSLLRS